MIHLWWSFTLSWKSICNSLRLCCFNMIAVWPFGPVVITPLHTPNWDLKSVLIQQRTWNDRVYSTPSFASVKWSLRPCHFFQNANAKERAADNKRKQEQAPTACLSVISKNVRAQNSALVTAGKLRISPCQRRKLSNCISHRRLRPIIP